MNNLKKLFNNEFIKKYFLVVVAIFVYAINLKTLVYSANLIGSGIMGLSIFVQRVLIDFYKIDIPLTVISILFNIIPALIAWIYVGKKFTIISFIILFLLTFVADFIPTIKVTEDYVISAVFAGVLNGFSLGIILKTGLSSGGSDFISVAVAKKYHKPIFNYILVFNILLITVQGYLYSFQEAFYSIIFQFVTTQMINYLYRHFEKRTIMIITEKPEEISKEVIEHSSHTVSEFKGIGCYSHKEKYLLYIIVTEPELKFILQLIRDVDKDAFINVMKSMEVSGNFNYLPVV